MIFSKCLPLPSCSVCSGNVPWSEPSTNTLASEPALALFTSSHPNIGRIFTLTDAFSAVTVTEPTSVW